MTAILSVFTYPWMVGLAPLIGLAVAATVLAGQARRRARLARFGTPEALARLAPQDAAHPPRWRATRLGVAALLLAIACAGPRWGAATAVIESQGLDIAIAMDVSLSMLAEDERPNRLERMKQEVRRMRAIAPGDRVALMAFAGRAYTLTPLTSDDGALELFLENLDPTVVGIVGSHVSPALRQGIDLLKSAAGGADRALVVMSDGESFDDRDDALAFAREAQGEGIHVVTVGFGTPGGATIPLPETGGADVKRDLAGAIVVTRYDADLLRDVAAAAQGTFVPAELTDKGTRVRRALAELEMAKREEELHQSRPPQHAWFVFIAVVLLLLDAWLADGGRWPFRRLVVERRLAVLALALLPGLAQAQAASAERAIEHHRAGRLLEAIREYRRAIAEGDRRPRVMYDLGTALLSADSLDAAIEVLERTTHLPNAEVRQRARYNLGLAYLKRGLRLDGEARTNAMLHARRELRTVLLESPGDPAAQWNYEMALRQSTAPPQSSSPQPPPEQQQQQQQRDQMTRQQAEALLDAAARDEREVQSRRQRSDPRRRTAGSKDW